MSYVISDSDQQLAAAAKIQFVNGEVEFQFPPQVESDSRSCIWKELKINFIEVPVNYLGSYPREITVSWTYLLVPAGGRPTA